MRAASQVLTVQSACREEAEQLLGRPVTAAEAAQELGSACSLAAITDGPNGSQVSALGRILVCPGCSSMIDPRQLLMCLGPLLR